MAPEVRSTQFCPSGAIVLEIPSYRWFHGSHLDLGDFSLNIYLFIETPRGGAPPPTHSWRICDRGLVLAGVLGVLGFLGILAKNLEKIVPEPSQIEFRGLQNRAWSPPKRHF